MDHSWEIWLSCGSYAVSRNEHYCKPFMKHFKGKRQRRRILMNSTATFLHCFDAPSGLLHWMFYTMLTIANVLFRSERNLNSFRSFSFIDLFIIFPYRFRRYVSFLQTLSSTHIWFLQETRYSHAILLNFLDNLKFQLAMHSFLESVRYPWRVIVCQSSHALCLRQYQTIPDFSLP